MNDSIAMSFIALGIIFDILGCIGIARMPDIYCRLQTATKCVTMGTFSIMVGMFVMFGFTSVGIKSLVCGLFLLLTSPTAAHALSRGAYRSGVKMWKGGVIDKYGEDIKK